MTQKTSSLQFNRWILFVCVFIPSVFSTLLYPLALIFVLAQQWNKEESVSLDPLMLSGLILISVVSAFFAWWLPGLVDKKLIKFFDKKESPIFQIIRLYVFVIISNGFSVWVVGAGFAIGYLSHQEYISIPFAVIGLGLLLSKCNPLKLKLEMDHA